MYTGDELAINKKLSKGALHALSQQ